MEEKRTQTPHDEDEHHEVACPLCLLMNTVSKTTRRHSAFFHHLMNAQIEVLHAFKSVIDQKISRLEDKKKSMVDTKKATKIEVE